MSSEQINIASLNKSFILKHTQPAMDLSQVTAAVINFKHGKVGKSSIPNVPVNYTCSKRQKDGKSFIPRFIILNSKQAKNGKPELSHINTISLEKDKTSISYSPSNYCKQTKSRSYIPRKTAKKGDTQTQEKPQQKVISSPLFGKSKIPVPISTKKSKVSSPNNNSIKKVNVMTRTSHRNCSICSPSLDKIKKEKKEKKENARVLRFNDNKIRVLTSNPIKNDDSSSRSSTPTSTPTSTRTSTPTSTRTPTPTSTRTPTPIPTRTPTPTSIKKSLIPVHNKLSYSLFKKRVSPLQPSAITLIKKDDLIPISNSNEKTSDLIHTSLKNKCTSLQKSVNKPEASISISHSKVEFTTTTSIIKPELSSISLLHKAEKDLSGVKNQAEEDGKGVLFGNVFKTIVRYSKDLFSKLIV